MHRLVVSAVFASGLMVVSHGARADRVPVRVVDAAAEKTVWTGTFTGGIAPPAEPYEWAATYYDARLVVTKRKGEEIEAELWVAEDSKGLALRGTLKPGGSLRLKVTNVLKGEWAEDLAGRATAVGGLKRGRLSFRYEIPATRPRWGECQLRLAPWLSKTS